MISSLSARRAKVLEFIVGDYIATAAPVASEVVSRSRNLRVSPATVRNEMAALEEEGYIIRPHVSAGGVPTDKGYRYYVQFPSQGAELSDKVKRTVHQRFQEVEHDVDAWTRLVAQMLSELARNLAVATFPRASKSRVQHLELVYLQEALTLLILVLQEARLRKELVSWTTPVSREDLVMVTNKMNDQFAGLSREEVLKKPVELAPLEQQVRDEIVRVMEEEEKTFSVDYLTEGVRHLLAQPEFEASPRAREVVEALEERRLVQAILQETPAMGDLRVIIGEENQEETLKPMSVVIARYGVPGGSAGTVAVLGPTRMDYHKNIAGVQYLTSLMSELIEGIHGRMSVN